MASNGMDGEGGMVNEAAGDSIQTRRNSRGGKCAVGRAVCRISIGAMKLFKGIE